MSHLRCGRRRRTRGNVTCTFTLCVALLPIRASTWCFDVKCCQDTLACDWRGKQYKFVVLHLIDLPCQLYLTFVRQTRADRKY